LGTVALFIVITVVPGISAIDKETDENNKLKDSNEIGTIDEYAEIITFIKGWAWINWIKRRGLFRGEVNFTWTHCQGAFINLTGFRRSANGIEYYNTHVVLGFVHAYRFIRLYTPNPFMEPIVNGIAIGNIEWDEVA
jgi:hypothetical protein